MDDREVMQRVMQVLGPRSVSECDGCSYEINEAIRLLREAGIEYQQRRKKPAHDVEAERRGN